MAHGFVEGQIIGDRYRLDRVLGQGGMGAVFMATHTTTGRRGALKVILPEKALRDGALARFQREAQALGRIDSPYVTQVLDAGTDLATGAAFLVMELFEGEDVGRLGERLGPLPPQLAARIAAQALAGLQAAHDAGIIHRDVKPANLFLATRAGGERMVKVLDFGIVKLLDQATGDEPAPKKLTATGSVFGSAPYMSPEQVSASKALDHRTDVWSLGVSLYEMLAGRLAFSGSDLMQVLLQIGFGGAPPLTSVAPWVPREVVAIVERAMRREPTERYASAAAMAHELRAWMRGETAISETLVVALPRELWADVAPAIGDAVPPGGAARPAAAGGTMPVPPSAVAPPVPGAASSATPAEASALPDGGLPAAVQHGPRATLASPGTAVSRGVVLRWLAVAAAVVLVAIAVVAAWTVVASERTAAPVITAAPVGSTAEIPVAAEPPVQVAPATASSSNGSGGAAVGGSGAVAPGVGSGATRPPLPSGRSGPTKTTSDNPFGTGAK